MLIYDYRGHGGIMYKSKKKGESHVIEGNIESEIIRVDIQ
jgi:hypothetical protein